MWPQVAFVGQFMEFSWEFHGNRGGEILVQIWYNFSTNLVQNWYNFGTSLVQNWYNFGTFLVQIWYNFGIILV